MMRRRMPIARGAWIRVCFVAASLLAIHCGNEGFLPLFPAVTGDVAVGVSISQQPEVESLDLDPPPPLQMGASAQLLLTARTDPMHQISYFWVATCAGQFNDPNIIDPIFTLEDEGDEDCTFVVTIEDIDLQVSSLGSFEIPINQQF